ncbi:MAG: (Fe-S)-binding protein [Candidatus Neoclostridium sp.]
MNITEKAKNIADSCRFCWMCRHVCPIGNATGQERNTARARSLGVSLVVRGATELKEIADNIYECTLCGACTNNCVTGWDPKVFIQEVKTEIVLNGETPDYIVRLLEKYQATGNVYGAEACDGSDELYNTESETALFVGQDALYKSPESVKNAVKLLNKAGVKVSLPKRQDSGAALWFLTGKTQETQDAAKKCASALSAFKTVVVYDPVDLSLMLHEYKEWGIEIGAKIIGFNEYLLSLIESGKIVVKKSENEYSLQDNYAYARELDDCDTGRNLIEKAGKVKDMLLIGKEANLAGQLIMAEYMPEVIAQVAKDRWKNAVNMECKTVVTENPAEYVALKATAPKGYRVISVEEMILENI